MPAKKNIRTEQQKKSAIKQYYEVYAEGLTQLEVLTEKMKLAMNKDSLSEVHIQHKNRLIKFEQFLHIHQQEQIQHSTRRPYPRWSQVETITSCTSHANLKLEDIEVECLMAIIPVFIRARNSIDVYFRALQILTT